MAATVTAIRLKHICRFKDRHGHQRHYLRVPGSKPVALPGAPGSPEFMAAYQAGLAATAPQPPGVPAPAAGSFDWLACAYYRSGAFTSLRESTQRAYRRIVEEIRAKHGSKPVRMLNAEAIRRLLEEKAGTPTAANHRLKLLRALLAIAVERQLLPADPSAGIARVRFRTAGYPTWSEAEIAQYEAHWPSGSRERLAFALLLYTGLRRSDVVRLGRQHLAEIVLEDGRRVPALRLRAVKTERDMMLPIHSALAAELTQVPEGRLTFLLTEFGKAFSPRGFYNQFMPWAAAAGVPAHRSPHGLRKACGRRLAEAGATGHQIMSVLGVTLSVAEVYTRAAQQGRMAVAGMARIVALPGNKTRG